MTAHARQMPEWCLDCGEIARLLRWLRDDDAGLDLADAIAIVEKPWNWTTEYEQMRAEQRRPDEPAFDDLGY